MKKVFSSLFAICAISLCAVAGDPKPLSVYLIGDMPMKTVSSKVSETAGWGDFFQEQLISAATVQNYAVADASSRSFLVSYWGDVKGKLTKGSVVLVGFGNHDANQSDEARYADIHIYQENLKQLIKEIKKKGCTPILLTPVCHRYRSRETGNWIDRFGYYSDATRHVAKGEKVALVDLNALTNEWIQALNPLDAALYFEPYEVENGKAIDEESVTLLSELGAQKIAEMVAEDMKTQKLKPIKKYIK